MLPRDKDIQPSYHNVDEMHVNQIAHEGAPRSLLASQTQSALDDVDTSMESRPFDSPGEAGSSPGSEGNPYVSKSEGVSDENRKRCGEDADVLKSPKKKTRVTRGVSALRDYRGCVLTTIDLASQLKGSGTGVNDTEKLRLVSEIEEDEWATSLSDPPSDTDVETEKDRVAEAKKSKHPDLSKGKYRHNGRIRSRYLIFFSR